MAYSFKVYTKPHGQYPLNLTDVDEALCAYFNAPVDPDRYLLGWVDAIGMRVAMGCSIEELNEEFNKEVVKGDEYSSYYSNLLKVLQHLTDNYELSGGGWVPSL